MEVGAPEANGEMIVNLRMRNGENDLVSMENLKVEVSRIENANREFEESRENKKEKIKEINRERELERNSQVGSEKGVVGIRKRWRPGGGLKYKPREKEKREKSQNRDSGTEC